MEEMYTENKRRFKEKEEVWARELKSLKEELDVLRARRKV